MSEPAMVLLRLLSDGEFHSGAAIGKILGVSRTAVWKYLQKLAAVGLSVESIKGRGYRVVGGLQLLDKSEICQRMDDKAVSLLSAVDVFSDVDSTNSVAAAADITGVVKGYACFAEYQRSGRGRRGRQWVSPFGHNIYMSLLWKFDGGSSQLEGLSLAVGLVVAKVLRASGLKGVELKWPNDILLDGRKLGGILLEMSGDPLGACDIVIGIGLNVRMPVDIDIDQPWAAISEQLPDLSRNHLAAQLVNGCIDMLLVFSQQGFSRYYLEWSSFDAYKGHTVVICSGQQSVEGVVVGISESGALCLLVDGVEQTFHSGEVSLRLANAT